MEGHAITTPAQRSENRRRALALAERHLRAADHSGRADQCERCRGAKVAGFPQCAGCWHLAVVGSTVPLFMGTLVENPSPLYSSFKLYKNLRDKSGDEHRNVMAAILSGAHEQHAAAVTVGLGGPPTIVTTVPSTRVSRPIHPLQGVIQLVAGLAESTGDCLEHAGLQRQRHQQQPGLFRTSRSVRDERILLVEDLWVRGTTADSAAQTLIEAGATVAVLTIGREMRREFATCGELLDSLPKPAWW